MINPQEWLEFGQKYYGHKYPAMPNGLRVGAAAMNALGVDRTGDTDLVAMLVISAKITVQLVLPTECK